MPIAVVVDVGGQVSEPDTARMIAACNAAVARGTCELDGAEAEGPARAIAIVRVIGQRGLVVRIEVGLREQQHAHWSVREIEFSPHDPPHERWRSVGLVLATLVGDIDSSSDPGIEANAGFGANTASSDTGPPPRSAESAASAVREATNPTSTVAPSPPRRERGVAPAAQRLPSLPAEDVRPPAPWPQPGFFIGAGILGAPGPKMESLRWGAGLRAEWIATRRWTLGMAVDYSHLALPNRELDVGWFRVGAGGGVRFWPSEHWSLGLEARFGVRALRIVPGSDGSIRSSAWSPLAVLDGGVWWRASRVGGLWASIETGTIGRATRLLGRDGAPTVVLPAADVQGLFGLWLAR